MTEIIEARDVYRFPPVGECIYCGADDSLSDEHIFPYGLTRNMVLPKASCSKCSAITSRIERRVLRGFMFDARVVGNMPTRRKKARPKTIRTKFLHNDDTIVEQEVPVHEAAAFLTIPMFPKLGLMSGEANRNGISIIGHETLTFGRNPDEVASNYGARGIRITSEVAVTEFVQLLAKIAYAYLVATEGLFPRDESPLPGLICGEESCLGCWVGSAEYRLQVEEKRPTHAAGTLPMRDSRGNEGRLVRVKLFANAGTTGYEVAARAPGWQNNERRGDK